MPRYFKPWVDWVQYYPQIAEFGQSMIAVGADLNGPFEYLPANAAAGLGIQLPTIGVIMQSFTNGKIAYCGIPPFKSLQ